MFVCVVLKPLIKRSLLFVQRNEIAQCFEKAYERLDVCEAARMLFLDSPTAAINYAKSVTILICNVLV